MSRARRPNLVLAVFVAGFVAGCAPKPQTINLNPQITVGQKFSYSADTEHEERMDQIFASSKPTPPIYKDNVWKVHLEGEAEVLLVNAKMGVQKVAFTVKSLTVSQNGIHMPRMPGAGATIIGERTGKFVVLIVDGKPASSDVTEAIGFVLPLDDDLVSRQEVFGTDKPVQAGNSWSVNTSSLAVMLKEELEMDSTNLGGVVKLDDCKGANADRIAMVSGSFSASIIIPPLPDVLTIDSATASGTLVGAFPASTGGKLVQSSSLITSIKGHGEKGGMKSTLLIMHVQKSSTTAIFH